MKFGCMEFVGHVKTPFSSVEERATDKFVHTQKLPSHAVYHVIGATHLQLIESFEWTVFEDQAGLSKFLLFCMILIKCRKGVFFPESKQSKGKLVMCPNKKEVKDLAKMKNKFPQWFEK